MANYWSSCCCVDWAFFEAEWYEFMVRDFTYADAVAKCNALDYATDLPAKTGSAPPGFLFISPLASHRSEDYTGTPSEFITIPIVNGNPDPADSDLSDSVDLSPSPVNNFTYFREVVWPALPSEFFSWQRNAGYRGGGQAAYWLSIALLQNFVSPGEDPQPVYLAHRARFRTSATRHGFIAVANMSQTGSTQEWSVSGVTYESSFTVSPDDWVELEIPETEDEEPSGGMIRFAVYDETPSQWAARTGIAISGGP